MARITVASLTTSNTALLARLDVAKQVYAAQRQRIADLEALLAAPARGRYVARPSAFVPLHVANPAAAAAREEAMRSGAAVLV